MAVITIDTAKKSINPGVFNLKQYLNGTETMIWELTENTTNNGEVTLDNYDVYLVMSSNGIVDEVLLSKQRANNKLRAVWDVGKYATELAGYVIYQIVFRSSQFDTLGVLSDETEIRGVYKLVDNNTFGTDRVFRKDNGYLVKWDATNLRWGIYNGSTLLDYQTVANQEPHCGQWESVAVGNTEAAAWFSHEAVMQVSESIAADQSVSAGFPTILRQLWARMSQSGVISVNGKSGEVTLYPADIGAAEAEHGHEIGDVNDLQKALNGKSPIGHGHAMAEVSGLQDALNGKAASSHTHNYLPLTGGTMTQSGAMKRNKDDSYIGVYGGTATDNSGAIELCGNSHSTYAGCFLLHANNGTSNVKLIGKPDGSLIWNGKSITLQGECLPVSGGKMTGNIRFAPSSGSVPTLFADGSSLAFAINSGESYTDGGYLRLYGKDNSDDKKGGFLFGTGDGSSVKVLVGKPDGSLTWDGKQVDRVEASGTNYIRYSSGLQICWGHAASGTHTTVTLPVAFANTNYAASILPYDSNGRLYQMALSGKKTTSFQINSNDGAEDCEKDWFAIGKWK